MKSLQFLTLFLLIPAGFVFGQAKNQSIYTSLATKDCKTLASNADQGESYRGSCPGVGGYKLEFLEGDLRQSLNVIAPGKKNFALNLWTVVSSGFSSLGEKVEWRVAGSGKAPSPRALIVRFNASENPEDSSKITSYLVVVKVTKSTACVTDIVNPSANQNEQARSLADAATGKSCLAPE